MWNFPISTLDIFLIKTGFSFYRNAIGPKITFFAIDKIYTYLVRTSLSDEFYRFPLYKSWKTFWCIQDITELRQIGTSSKEVTGDIQIIPEYNAWNVSINALCAKLCKFDVYSIHRRATAGQTSRRYLGNLHKVHTYVPTLRKRIQCFCREYIPYYAMVYFRFTLYTVSLFELLLVWF